MGGVLNRRAWLKSRVEGVCLQQRKNGAAKGVFLKGRKESREEETLEKRKNGTELNGSDESGREEKRKEHGWCQGVRSKQADKQASNDRTKDPTTTPCHNCSF